MKRVALLSFLFMGLVGVGLSHRLVTSVWSSPDENHPVSPLLLAASSPSKPNSITLPTALVSRPTKFSPGPEDARIAGIVSHLIEKRHYSQKVFDDSVSASFFNQYLDALDPLHLSLFQSDVREFEPYRYVLDDLTRRRGDLKPAYLIFDRYLQRFNEQVAFVTNALNTRSFEFDTQEEYLIQRRNAPRPKDAKEARQLWWNRLRYEYLQEKLSTTNAPSQSASSTIPENAPEGGRNHSTNFNASISGEASPSVAASGQDAETPTGVSSSKHEEIVKIITRRYVRQQRALQAIDSDDVLQFYLSSLTHAYDPHSDYMGKSTWESFAIGMRLSLFGIGAVLQSEDGYCKIRELMPGGPAIKSKKLKPNDRIVAVAQGEGEPVDVIDMKLNKVVELIRGPKGTEVRLTVLPADAPDTRKIVTLIRDEIKLESQEAKARIIEFTNQAPLRLGVIDLPIFYAEISEHGRTNNHKSTTTDVAALLKRLKQEKVDGVILDLRRNGGGSLPEAVNLSGLFIRKGPIVQIKEWSGEVAVREDPDPSIVYDGPLMVLTSRHSASASEILAGALQDYDRALVIGDSSTHGKGTVQELIQLEYFWRQLGIQATNNPGALKVTVSKFYRANGSSTQLKGVTPDVIMPSINNYAEIGEDSQPNALPWDTIPSAVFEKAEMLTPYRAELLKRSSARLALDPDIAYAHETIAYYTNLVATKRVSLHEATRLKEKKMLEAREKARKEELKKRPAPPYQVYELTLKQLDQPELTLLQKTNSTSTVVAPLSDEALESPHDESDSDIPAADLIMTEAQRILLDWISLKTGKASIAQTAQSLR